MSTVQNKNFLILDGPTQKTEEIRGELNKHGCKVFSIDCVNLSVGFIIEEKIDLIIHNQTAGDEMCLNLKKVLASVSIQNIVPVLSIVNDNNVESVLLHGATDYVTSSQTSQATLMKIENILGTNTGFSDKGMIDITPEATKITSEGVKVFVVEDDPLLRNLLSIKFSKTGFLHEFSNDGENIVNIMHQFAPDVIILDLMLPGKSGFDVLKEIKNTSTISNIPVIIFSNKDGVNDRAGAIELGADKFYVKALTDLSELVESIQNLVTK